MPRESSLRWMASPLAAIDLLSIIPYIVDLSTPHDNTLRGATLVRLLRTFSLLRMERTFKSFKRIADVVSPPRPREHILTHLRRHRRPHGCPGLLPTVRSALVRAYLLTYLLTYYLPYAAL